MKWKIKPYSKPPTRKDYGIEIETLIGSPSAAAPSSALSFTTASARSASPPLSSSACCSSGSGAAAPEKCRKHMGILGKMVENSWFV
jgi:hypothetical protein